MTAVVQWFGMGVMALGLLALGFGVYAILRLKSFYARMVVASKIEAMGFVAMTFGAMILAGFGMASLKLLIILVFELLTVAVSAHAIARSAWQSGYHLPPRPPPETPDA